MGLNDVPILYHESPPLKRCFGRSHSILPYFTFFFLAKDVCTINVASPGSLSNLVTMWRHNMVAISKVGNFRTRLPLSEILSDLIRCRLVRYPWFCSVRLRSWYISAILKHVNPYWSKFPSQSEASIWFFWFSEIRMFFHFVVKFNVLVDFCESCKNSGVISKVYAFDSACFYCCAQSQKKVHQVFLFAMRFQ